MSEQSFTSMAAQEVDDDIPVIGVGMLGYAFMGKAHSNAFRTIPYHDVSAARDPAHGFG